jgi:hypothetical protein
MISIVTIAITVGWAGAGWTSPPIISGEYIFYHLQKAKPNTYEAQETQQG